MPSCHARNNAASQMCYYVACLIVIYAVSAIMPRVNYAILRVLNKCRALNNVVSQMYVACSIMS